MVEETARHRCVNGYGATSFVIERRHVFTSQHGTEARRHHGTSWTTLLNGEPVRYIDAQTFEIVATGERLTHDPHACACVPAAKIATSGSCLDRSAWEA